jgi:hypothetical protein
MGEKEIGWDKDGTASADKYKFSVRMRVVSERCYFSCMMWNYTYISIKEGRVR